jgi:hypothetical protein
LHLLNKFEAIRLQFGLKKDATGKKEKFKDQNKNNYCHSESTVKCESVNNVFWYNAFPTMFRISYNDAGFF